MPYRVLVDKDNCISSGKCVADAPSVFRFGDDELAEASGNGALPDSQILAIARNCPGEAIQVFDGDAAVTI